MGYPHLRTGFTVGHPHRRLPLTKTQFLCGNELVTVPREVLASNLDPPTSQNPAHYVALLTGMIYPSIPERRLR
jgi:hypothetical protein